MPDQSANLTTFRKPGYRVRAKLSIFFGEEVMSATVNTAPTFPAFNLAITVDTGSHTDVDKNFRVDVLTGTDLKARIRVRNAGTISAANLPIREVSAFTAKIGLNDTVKVYREIRLDSYVPSDDENFEPDRLTYTDEGEDPPPVPTWGGPWAGAVDAGQAFATVETTGSNSYLVDPDSASAVTHLWTLPAGVAFQAGSVSTDANPILEANTRKEGYLVKHAVTDPDNTKVSTQYCPIIVEHADNTFACQVESLEGTELEGWFTTVRVLDDITEDVDGALAVLWFEETIDETTQSFGAASTGRSHIGMVGYLRRETGQRRGVLAGGQSSILTELRFDIISPLAWLGELPGFSKFMTRVAAPTNWRGVKGLDTQHAIIRLFQFYSNLFESGIDFIFNANYVNYDFPSFAIQKQTPLAQAREIADATDARIVCTRDARIEVQRRLELLPLGTDRDNTTTTATLTLQDVSSIEYEREHSEVLEIFRASGFIDATDEASTGAIFVKSGKAPGLGSGSGERRRLIGDGLQDFKDRVGRFGAAQNQVFVDSNGVRRVAPSMSLQARGVYRAIPDFYAEWVQVNWTGSSFKRGAAFDPSDFRYILNNVSLTFDSDRLNASVNMEFKAETHGEAGVVDPQTDHPVNLPTPSPHPPPPLNLNPTTPTTWLMQRGTQNIIAFNVDGFWYRCGPDFANSLVGFDVPSAQGGPVWERGALTGLGGTLWSFAVDPFSYNTASVDGWLSTSTGIYPITDLGGTPTVGAVVHSFAGVARSSFIDTSISDANWIFCVYYRQGAGTFAIRSTDGGSSWTEVAITAFSGTSSHAQRVAAYVSPFTAGLVYAEAFQASSNSNYYKSTDFGATWAVAPEGFATGSTALTGTLHGPWHNNASENTFYYGIRSGSNQLHRVVGATDTDITPQSRGPRYARAVATSTSNRNRVVAALNHVSLTPPKQFYSDDGGDTWTEITTGTDSNFVHVHVPDDVNTAYFLGLSGRIALMTDGQTIDDRRGNIPTDFAGAGEFVWLAGL